MALPKDLYVLYSILNMRLRDLYPNLDQLCEDINESKEDVIEAMRSIGFEYDEEINQFR